ncbi:NAD(+) synthase [bacterium]|nr:NAD(+) synthase [bacterium]
MDKLNNKIGIAQINTISGNIEYNAKKIVQGIKKAEENNLDLVVFPELALVGYGLEDTVKRYPIIVEQNKKWLEGIAKITTSTTAIVGFYDEKEGNVINSLAVLNNGKIQEIIHENHYNKVEINGTTYKITIGDSCFEVNNAEVIINCNSTISKPDKAEKFETPYSKLARLISTPIIYVNQVGAVDGYSFDGGSKLFDKNGQVVTCAKYFEEDFLIIDPFKTSTEITPQPDNKEKTFSLDYEPDMERTYKTLVQGIRDYFKKTGLQRAVLGLSGGLDSTVCAVLLADAIGAENVYGISMPSKLTSTESKTDAELLANNLGIHFAEAPIKEMVDTTDNNLQTLFKSVEENWTCRYKQSYTMDNIQARSRAVILFGISNEFASCIPIATSDKSESYMGYATINGDMSGGFAPIADVTKTKLFALARWLNKNREVKNSIPESIILKRPGAELAIDPKTGKTLCAEDALMPYEFMDEVIWRIENKHETYNEMLNSEFLYEKAHNISKEQKTEWLDKFYKRMSTAIYKWSIFPPSILVDSHSISKNDYKQPITTSGIDYKGISSDLIAEKIMSF